MTNLVGEILVNYMKAGIISWAITIVTLVCRLFYMAVKSEGLVFAQRGVDNFGAVTSRRKKASKLEMAVRFIIWPYGVIRVLTMYFEDEQRWIKKMKN